MFIAAWSWFTFWLFAHVLLVIVAFGPALAAFPLIGALAQKRPQHGTFAVEVTDFISRRMTIPLAVLVPFTGLGLIFTGKHQLWQSAWLIISIVLFTILFFYALFVQLPTGTKLLRAMQSMPPPPASGGGGPGGPPPEIAGLINRARVGGMFLSLLVVTILLLMIWQPGACRVGC
jgi:hypothetical protein